MGMRIHVPAREGRSFQVDAGQTIRVIDVQGQQVCDFWAFRVGHLSEYVSASHTRIACSRVWLARGDALVSNLRTPLLTLVDGQEGHDLLAPCCDPERYRRDYGLENHANCRENLFGVMKSYGLDYELLPDPVNLFERTRVGPEGEMEVVEPTTRAGDYALLRAEVDLIVAVSACPQDQNPCNGFNPTDIMIEVA
jgi:uncharacterized protein